MHLFCSKGYLLKLHRLAMNPLMEFFSHIIKYTAYKRDLYTISVQLFSVTN